MIDMKKIAKFSFALLFIFILSFTSLTASAVDSTLAVASTPFQTHQGENFTTTIYIPDNANIVDFDITLKYDTDLIKLESIVENEDIKGTVIFNADTEGVIRINYTRTSKNVTKYTPLVDLTFKVDDNIGVDVYDCLSIDESQEYIAHRLNDTGTLDVVNFTCDFAELYIYEMGDVDLSCRVDIGDATYVRRHLAQFEGATLSDFKLTLADTYYDGIVDIADAVCLQRHLVKLGVVYGNRVNITFYDMNGNKYMAKSVLYDGTLKSVPEVPDVEGFYGGKWSQSPDEYVAPVYNNLSEDISLYAYYDGEEDLAMEYYRKTLSNMYYSGDMPTNLSSDQNLEKTLYYQQGQYANIVWSSDCNYILNSTTGAFTKPTYPEELTLTATITSYTAEDMIDSVGSISFDYKVPGVYLTPTKAEIEGFLNHYFTDTVDGKYRINYDVKLISKLNNVVLPVEGALYDNFEVRLNWYQNVDGELQPISQVKRTTSPQINDYVAVATFNGKPIDGDGKIYIDNVEVTPIEQIEVKNFIIKQIAANMGTLATDGTVLWSEENIYNTNVTWETGAPDIAYVANNVIQLKESAVSGQTLPLNARVSYETADGADEFVLSYNLTVSCDNTIIKAPENMDVNLYKAIKEQLEETMGYRGDLTSAALASVKFVNLDLSDYGPGAYDIDENGNRVDREINSLRGLSYCKNLRTLNISNLNITDGTMNQIATLSYLEAFIARGCELDNLSDGGQATLRNAVGLKMIDLTDNDFTSLDSVFAEGVRYGKLREVYLSKNNLTDINALSRAPIMTYLSLSDNGLTTEGTASIANYPYLTYLSLANNKIDSIEHLKGLKYLQELRLHNNNLSNVNDLRRLANLEILYLGHNDIQDISLLNSLSKLEVLYVNNNKLFDVSALNSLSKLEIVNFSNNDLSSLSVLSNYKSTLTEIYAENNKLTDFSFINGASKLHILMLAGNAIDLAQNNMTTWLSALPEMEVLTLSDIRLNDLSFLSSMEKLARLDVANCGLTATFGEGSSNIGLVAERYATLKVLDISNNDMSGSENELLKLRDVTLLTVLYANNICDKLDVNTLTYSMAELKFISLENCGITSASWLSKYDKLAYVDLAGNDIPNVDLNTYISNASKKTIKELYLDTNVDCSFTNAYLATDFNVEKLSLEGVSIGKMEYMPAELPNIKYLNLANTGLDSLIGTDESLSDLYSIEKYSTLETVDVSGIEADISVLENMDSIKTVYAVDTPDGNLFFENNLHSLQRLYNKGVTCYLYDKETEYVPTATKEGTDILNLIKDFSCDVTVAADNVLSDNNPFIIDEINGFDITWTLSNSDNYEIVDNHLAVKDYTKLEDEVLTVTAEITVYPDQEPVTRDFTISTHILRASSKYFKTDLTGYSEQLTRDAEFNYNVTLVANETEGFSNPVKPVEDSIAYKYSTTNGIPYVNIITEGTNHSYKINSAAPLGATLTIDIVATHIGKDGSVVEDSEHIFAPVTIASRTYNVTFVTNGGSIKDTNGVERETISLVEDSLIFAGLTYSKPGYVFDGWYSDEALKTKFCEDPATVIMPSEDITLYAKWNALEYTVNFDANGGTVEQTTKVALSDVELGELPTPTRTYYTFNGWFTAQTGGEKVVATSKFARTDDLTLYAQWTLNSFVVTFDANGGSTPTSSLRAYCGETLGTLPTPTRDYYNFLGWYTATSGGTKVTNTTKYDVAKDITLYAMWELKPVEGWVLKSEMPTGAQVIETKWDYTLREYTSGSNSTLSGWTNYDTVRTSWGAWSGWSTTNPTNGVRNVQQRTEYHYYRWIKGNYVYTYNPGGYTLEEIWITEDLPISSINNSYEIRYRGTDTYANRWIRADYEYNRDVSKTFTRITYRYQEPIYTYYFYRDVAMTTTSGNPTGQADVSNVKEYVKYRSK